MGSSTAACLTCGETFTAYRASTRPAAKFCSRACSNRAPRVFGNSRKTHCANGHEFTEENMHIRPSGARACRECSRQRSQAFKDRNREKVRTDARDYAKERYATDPEFAERMRQRSRDIDPAVRSEARKRSYARNADKRRAESAAYRAAHPEKVREWSATSYAKNYDRMLAHNALRRARIKNAPRTEYIDRIAVYERDGGRCHICGRKCPRSAFHIDHLVPLSKGGDHVYANVATSHPRCNQRRQAGVIPAQLRLVG